MVANITLSMQNIGIQLADYCGYIMAGAHLHNAVFKNKLNSKEIKDWPDMELLIKLQGERRMFPKVRSTNDDDFFFTYGRARGVERPCCYAQGRVCPFNRRKLAHNSAVSSVFFNRRYSTSD
jgi:hypothetical protein